MPYNQQNTWEPEFDEPTEPIPTEVVELRQLWRRLETTEAQDYRFRAVPSAQLPLVLRELGRDIGRAQRDVMLYMNLVEEIKRGAMWPVPPDSGDWPAYNLDVEPSEADAGDTADDKELERLIKFQKRLLDVHTGRTLTRARALGMKSFVGPDDETGLPPHEDSRAFRPFLGKVFKRIKEAAQFIWGLVKRCGTLLASAFQAGDIVGEVNVNVDMQFPVPSVGLELTPKVFLDNSTLDVVSEFAKGMSDEIGDAFA